MMKINYFKLIPVLFSSLVFSQVGINTDSPMATFEVKSNPLLQRADGIMAPRATKADLINKTGLYSTDQTSAFVYVTDAITASTDVKFTNIDDVGYNYFDGTAWQKMKGTDVVTAPANEWYLNGNTITDGQFLNPANTS